MVELEPLVELTRNDPILFVEGLLHVGAAASLETSLENPAAG